MRMLQIAVMTAQAVLAIFYVGAGVIKMMMPMAELPDLIPWTGDYSAGFVRFTGFVDLLAGLGIVLPDALHILPRLTLLAAVGSALLQILAIFFHIWRGEFAVLMINFPALALSVFVMWGWGKNPHQDQDRPA